MIFAHGALFKGLVARKGWASDSSCAAKAHSGAHETNQALERFRNNGAAEKRGPSRSARVCRSMSGRSAILLLPSPPCSTALCCAEPTAVRMKAYCRRMSRLPCLLILGLLVALLRPPPACAVAARSESLPHDEEAPLGDFSGSRKLANSGEVLPPTLGTSHLDGSYKE